MVKIHEIEGYIATLYLVEYSDKLLLLDGGCACDVTRVKTHIEQTLKRSFLDLKLVIVTHSHPDHSGGAKIYQSLGIEVAGYIEHNKWYAGLSGKLTFIADIFLTYLVAAKKGRKKENIWFNPSIKFNITLKDGDYIPGFSDWQAILCPGHTFYDLSLYRKENALAYIADNVVGNEKKKFRPYPLAAPEKYIKTLKWYQEEGIQHFLLAHHGKQSISYTEFQNLIETTPSRPRVHKTNFLVILKHILKSFFR